VEHFENETEVDANLYVWDMRTAHRLRLREAYVCVWL
jgi:hypothetical protein